MHSSLLIYDSFNLQLKLMFKKEIIMNLICKKIKEICIKPIDFTELGKCYLQN